MSRSGYVYDCEDNWAIICYAGAVRSAIRGARGQALLREMLAVLDAMPDKSLIVGELIDDEGAVCALGAVGKQRAYSDLSELDPFDVTEVANRFGIAESLAREIMFQNDEYDYCATPEERWEIVRNWVAQQIK